MVTDVTIAPAQPLRALERANEVRLARAELKRRIASGALGVAEVVLACPSEAMRMPVSDLLMCQRRWGRARCRRLLLSLRLEESKTLGGLTARQRHLLAAMLDMYPAPAQRLEPVAV